MSATYLKPQGMGRLGELLTSIRLVVFDFDGVFTDNTVIVTQDGIEAVQCSRSDGIGLSRLRMLDVPFLILSTEANPVVTKRAQKLKAPCQQGVEDKSMALLDYAKTMAVDLSEVAYVGNDINDIPAMQQVGLPIAVADAFPEVFPHVLYKTVRNGGYGAVREVCDLIFYAKQGQFNFLESYASG